MKIQATKVVDIDITKVRLDAKIRDEGIYTFFDNDGEEYTSREGYVPSFFPGDHYGDYLELIIDLETGMIVNWDKTKVERYLQSYLGDE